MVELSSLLAGTGAEVSRSCLISAIFTDSRCVLPGSLFIATCELLDSAHTHIAEAIAAGAVAVLHSDPAYDVAQYPDVIFIVSDDLLMLSGVLVSRFYGDPSHQMHCIGITGTNGKTTVSHGVAQAMSCIGASCAVVGTNGAGFLGELTSTGMTTPDILTIQQLLARYRDEGASAVAMEVSSHGLVQGRAVGTAIDVAVVTQVARDHLDYHGSLEAYQQAKERLLQWPGLRAAVLNINDPLVYQWAERYADDYQIVSYSWDGRMSIAGVPCLSMTDRRWDGQCYHFHVTSPWGTVASSTALLGDFNSENLLAIVGVLYACGYSFEEAVGTLPQIQAPLGRMQRFGGGDQPEVIVDFAHTPDALSAALQAMRALCQGRLFCVWGCGGGRDRGKRPLMTQAVAAYADQLVMTTDNAREDTWASILVDMQEGLSGSESVYQEPDRAAAIAWAIEQAEPGDWILIAGKGHEHMQVDSRGAHPFSDQREVCAALGFVAPTE